MGPFDLALESSGNLLVSDPSGYRIIRLDTTLKPIASFGAPGSQVGSLNFPKGLAVDASVWCTWSIPTTAGSRCLTAQGRLSRR